MYHFIAGLKSSLNHLLGLTLNSISFKLYGYLEKHNPRVPIEVTVNNKWFRKGQKVIKGLENWTQSGVSCQGRSL